MLLGSVLAYSGPILLEYILDNLSSKSFSFEKGCLYASIFFGFYFIKPFLQ